MKYNIIKFDISRKDGDNIDETIMQDARDLLAALAGEAGCESFENTENGINGYIQANITDKNAIDAALDFFPFNEISIAYTISEAEDKNWNRQWEDAGFEPIAIGNRCMIHDTKHPSSPGTDADIDITIDARQAFGTGTHETTRMIVTRLLDTDMTGKSVLDCGCGTGILSIVASKCGACCITGYDIDEWSVRNTEHNAAINNVSNINVLHGDVNIVAEDGQMFDIVLANINRNILLNDMNAMKNKIKQGGTLIISGFYESDEQMLKDKAATTGLTLEKTERENGWSMMVFTLV
ncbi:50S ribosomal protein L11 methyltransferase [Xylanibacter caecicola]|uniref:50S ribosomal protein L11 methyltransferase n=1 Tax=Xylanibacter caecicola TaxID=2736294 RepID=UPI002585C616|nr:50S ribosomal protein L11 methyltransferase [Xylanibacter caecicola]